MNPHNIDEVMEASQATFRRDEIAEAIDRLAEEIRTTRAELLTIASRFVGPVAPLAQSERLQYPYCDACQSYHHPDYWLCKKLPQPENLQEAIKCTCGHYPADHTHDQQSGPTNCGHEGCGCAMYQAQRQEAHS